jgi:hypothetical protein
MDNIFIIAIIVAVIFFITKFVEMRFVEKEPKPIKLLARDAIIVYFSVVTSYFLIDQIMPFTQTGGTIVPVNLSKQPPVFTDGPDF